MVIFSKNTEAKQMQVSALVEENVLRIRLSGEMDESSAPRARVKCDRLIDEHINADKIIINLSGVKFMDSTGIGFLIGRYKKAARLNIPIFVEQPDFAADKVLNLSGVYSLIPKA